ncbi:MAG: hypothetical protein LBQ97_04795 [Fusobacteriaceae bacterium]|jgi:hypothetical protein|nr:hypothetical protein [Fusobacteriaceae bacterium]
MKRLKRCAATAFLTLVFAAAACASGALKSELTEDYAAQAEKYMGQFIRAYSSDALEGTGNIAMALAEDFEDDLTITRYTLNKKPIRYRFFYAGEGRSRAVDYYLVSADFLLVHDTLQVNSSQYVSTSMDDVLYFDVSKYFIIKGKAYYYVPELRTGIPVTEKSDILTSAAELAAVFAKIQKKR